MLLTPQACSGTLFFPHSGELLSHRNKPPCLKKIDIFIELEAGTRQNKKQRLKNAELISKQVHVNEKQKLTFNTWTMPVWQFLVPRPGQQDQISFFKAEIIKGYIPSSENKKSFKRKVLCCRKGFEWNDSS